MANLKSILRSVGWVLLSDDRIRDEDRIGYEYHVAILGFYHCGPYAYFDDFSFKGLHLDLVSHLEGPVRLHENPRHKILNYCAHGKAYGNAESP